MKNTQSFDLNNIEILVFDEADRLIQMGFKNEIDYIISELGKRHQTMLFSATLNNTIKDLARMSLIDPIYIDMSGSNVIPERIKQ